jgi:hypothetical protein
LSVPVSNKKNYTYESASYMSCKKFDTICIRTSPSHKMNSFIHGKL